MCCDNVTINKKDTYSNTSYTIVYPYAVNVNLMLICIELSKIWLVIVNMPEDLWYLK